MSSPKSLRASSDQLSLFDEVPTAPAPSPRAPLLAPAAQPRQSGPHVDLGERRLPYTLTRCRRSTIGFSIGPEGLRVRAPRWVAVSDIEKAMRERSTWILRKWSECEQRVQQLEALRVVWQDGATLPFLGLPLRLRLQADGGRGAAEFRPAAELESLPELWLRLPSDAQESQWRDAVQAWLQARAREHFEPRLAHYATLLDVQVEKLRLSSAQGRWGSANSRGVVCLNWRLIHFSPAVIDYVIAHEIAHLREMNHGPRFWALVGELLPGFESQREELKRAQLPPL